MIAAFTGIKIHLCTQPTDMRRGFDGLSGMVTSLLERDPLSGHLFVSRNRNRDKLKILYWDTDGLAAWYKRLEQGTFQFPTDGAKENFRPGLRSRTTGFILSPMVRSSKWLVGLIAVVTG